MSFSGEIKEEVARILPEERHCLQAEIAAMIRFSGIVQKDKGNESILVETENVTLAKKYLILIKKAYDIQVNLQIRERGTAKNSHVYSILLRSKTVEEVDIEEEKKKRLYRVLEETTSWEDPRFSKILLHDSCCRRAFLRGAFLSAGSMSNPGKSYHFEIVCKEQGIAEHLMEVMNHFHIFPKMVLRKNKYIVYIKDSAGIVDMLNVIEAHQSLMELENIRIIKDMKNSANRQHNCDYANINKIVRTASRQLEDIQYIEQKVGLDYLQPALREIAVIRQEHPDVSLQELGTFLNPPVGKSGVNHRLKKIGEIAKKLKEEAGVVYE